MTGGYYDSTDRGMRIRVLQRMLRALAEPDVRENGQYDEVTREAVRRFQRMRGYPATGIADRRTWEEMSRLYWEREAEVMIEGIRPFVGRERRIYPRERSDLVMILQLVLNELGIRYDGLGPIPLSGIYDEMTEGAVREFQRINLLPMDGVTDARTWNRMVRQYNDVVRDRRQ